MKLGHFSIIMPAYNAEKTIAISIGSVIKQTCKSWTLYVIDDASFDKTRDVVEAIANEDPRVIYCKMERNSGVAATRNIGIDKADGEFISFLDSDDIWHEEKLSEQLIYLNKGCDVVCSDYFIFSEKTINVIGQSDKKEYFTYFDMLRSNNIGNLTGTYNRGKLGAFNQKNIGHEDYVMWLEIMSVASNAYCIKKPLAFYRFSSSSLSGNKIKAAMWQWNIYRKTLGLSFLSSLNYWIQYASSAIISRILDRIKFSKYKI